MLPQKLLCVFSEVCQWSYLIFYPLLRLLEDLEYFRFLCRLAFFEMVFYPWLEFAWNYKTIIQKSYNSLTRYQHVFGIGNSKKKVAKDSNWRKLENEAEKLGDLIVERLLAAK